MSYESILEIRNVTKSYGNHVAVDDLSFDVGQGEILAFLGPNGAGKTTTMRMILDILKPDRGQIKVFGAPLTEESKDRIGYMPEERGLYRNVQLGDLLSYLGALKGMTQQDARQRASELLKLVDLDEYEKSKVSALSKGMSQKVQFIATIIHRPELIIVDEPFSGLDPVNTQTLQAMVVDLAHQGTTIVMSTHQMWQAEEMADRLLMIDHGRRVLYGEVEEVRSRFAEDAVLVEGTGDWAALPGVKSVSVNDSGREYTLHLAPGKTIDDLMQAVAASPNHHVKRFELAVPDLNEIFIQVVGGNHNHA